MRHAAADFAGDWSGAGIYLRLWGDVDACDCPELEGLRERLRRADRVHVDLASLEFAGATFLGWLASICEDAAAKEGVLVLEAVPQSLAARLALLGMDGHFEAAVESPGGVLLRYPRREWNGRAARSFVCGARESR